MEINGKITTVSLLLDFLVVQLTCYNDLFTHVQFLNIQFTFLNLLKAYLLWSYDLQTSQHKPRF